MAAPLSATANNIASSSRSLLTRQALIGRAEVERAQVGTGPTRNGRRVREDFGRPDAAHQSESSDSDSETSASAPSTLFSRSAGSDSAATSHSMHSQTEELGSDVLSALSLSPAPSMYSLTDSLRAQSKHLEFGREVNSYSDVYRLPADIDEISRLDKQHLLFKDVMGDYVQPVREVLGDPDGEYEERKQVLDLGCGSGAWLIDAAHDFPHAMCIGVDLVPMPMPLENLPSNCVYEVDDVNLGLEHFAGQFNVVHVRLISMGIKDYYRVIDDSAACLRPGGVADFMECDFRLYDRHHKAIVPTQEEIWGDLQPPPDFLGTGMSSFTEQLSAAAALSSAKATSRHGKGRATSSPYLARWFHAARQAGSKRGGQVDAAALMHNWVSAHRSFQDVQYREFWLPYGPWMRGRPEYIALAQYERFCTIGDVMQEDIAEFLRSGRPLLLSAGFPEAVVDELESQATREVREAKIPMFFKVQNVYARKDDRPEEGP